MNINIHLLKKVISDGVYELDFKKLGYKDVPQVTSPYSGKGLPFVINEKGRNLC